MTKIQRAIATVLALALFGLVPAVVNVPAASAALSCPLSNPNMNNGYVCADADFITGQGYIIVRGSAITSGNFYRLEMQSKIGTQPWQTRCTVNLKSPHYCSGTSGFATPPPGSNTQVRAKLWFTSTSYGYYDVPIVQV